jgi:hypothetical protein
MTLIFRPSTELLLKNLQHELPQSLLLSGPKGIGLFSTAHHMSRTPSLVVFPKNAKGDVDREGGSISVEAIRDLYHQTRTRASKARIVIIMNAERMSRSAQAAFLKLLEEPNSTTHFILASHSPDSLLPTIRSRTQWFSVQPLTVEQSKTLIKRLGITDATKQAQLLFLANGLPAELTKLATDEGYFAQFAGLIQDARTFITADTYQKLRLIQKYRNNREEALRFIDSIMNILRYTLQSNPQHKLIEQLERLLEARERIAANQSIPLQLANAVL